MLSTLSSSAAAGSFPDPPDLQEGSQIMGTDDKAENKAEHAGGKLKEGAGDLTDNEDLQAEGKKDQLKANAKDVGEDVKDTFKNR